MDCKRFEITDSEEFKRYCECLAYLASGYVPSIRKQFAAKAFEMYQNETVVKIVLAYGQEYEKKRDDFQKNFLWAAQDENSSEYNEIHFKTSCLNNASVFGQIIKLLFGVI